MVLQSTIKWLSSGYLENIEPSIESKRYVPASPASAQMSLKFDAGAPLTASINALAALPSRQPIRKLQAVCLLATRATLEQHHVKCSSQSSLCITLSSSSICTIPPGNLASLILNRKHRSFQSPSAGYPRQIHDIPRPRSCIMSQDTGLFSVRRPREVRRRAQNPFHFRCSPPNPSKRD